MESLLVGFPQTGVWGPWCCRWRLRVWRSLTLGPNAVPPHPRPVPPGGSWPPVHLAVGRQPHMPPSPVPRPPVCSPQPVPHSGSSGYGSLGSNGSHEHLMSQTSSSDSNGHEDARRRRAVGPSACVCSLPSPPPVPICGTRRSHRALKHCLLVTAQVPQAAPKLSSPGLTSPALEN